MKVNVLDRDTSRIASWKSAHLPIHEPGLDAVVRIARDGGRIRSGTTSTTVNEAALRQGNLHFSTDSANCIGEADVIFLSVNTPTKYSGRGAGSASDLSALEGATRDIAQFAKNGAIIVEKSTVPCGTANLISDVVSSMQSPSSTAHCSSSPPCDLTKHSLSYPTPSSWLRDQRLRTFSIRIAFLLEVLLL